MDQVLKKEGGRGIIAVGVLGSDIFDKLMILRALKIRMPRTIFFTNNLDAWLWDKEELKSTKNLIVASPYGLALDSRYQRGVPPFRDSYQTSAFAAALSALGMIPRHQFMPADPVGAVRLFEIGLHGPHEMSTNTLFTDKKRNDQDEKKKRWNANLWETKGEGGRGRVLIGSLHPPRPDSKEWWEAADRRWSGLLMILTSGAAVALWWLLVHRGERHGYGDGMKGICRGVCASSGLVVLLGVPLVIWTAYRMWGLDRFEGEPFLFNSGISAWPSETLRMMAIILGFHFIWKSFFILDNNRRTIEERFFDGKPNPPPPKAENGGKTNGNPMKRYAAFLGENLAWKSNSVQMRDVPSNPVIRIPEPASGGPPQPPAMERKQLLNPLILWQEFQSRGTLHLRAVRTVIVFAILSIILHLVFQLLDDGSPPVRGRSTLYLFGLLSLADLDGLLDFLSLFTLVLLTTFVLDSMRLSRDFIQRFAAAESDWSALRPKFNGRKLRHEIIDGYIDLKITGQLTSEVMRLAFFPFYVLGLLLLARISRFDNWGWPPAVMVVFSSIVALLIFGAVRVRAQADQMRKEALADFQAHCDAGNAGGDGGPGDDNSVKAHRIEITAFREGAFAPFSEQPTMKAVFWLIGAIGAGGLWQYLAQMFG